MKCLTVCEPFASAIVFGGKCIENRQRTIGHVGPLLIHAGKSLDWFSPEGIAWLHDRWDGCPANPVRAMHEFKPRMGKVIGMVYACAPANPDNLTELQRPWFTGPVGIPVLGASAIQIPFGVRGQQGVFTVPASELSDLVIELADDLCHVAAEGDWR